jgi:hypothetical protein
LLELEQKREMWDLERQLNAVKNGKRQVTVYITAGNVRPDDLNYAHDPEQGAINGYSKLLQIADTLKAGGFSCSPARAEHERGQYLKQKVSKRPATGSSEQSLSFERVQVGPKSHSNACPHPSLAWPAIGPRKRLGVIDFCSGFRMCK